MLTEQEITFAGAAIDRAAHLRPQAGELARSPAARSLVFWRGRPLTTDSAHPRLVWLAMDRPLLASGNAPVFLGLDSAGPDGAPRFATDISAVPGDDDGPDLRLPDGFAFTDLRQVMALLDPDEAGDAAAARALLAWHETHGFCARCGAASEVAAAGWQRDCPSCGAHHFPRTDPVAIVLATDGDRVLLGRSPGWPEGMYSLLAGFVEPGETVEAAARREVAEEAGVKLGPVRILITQPWPFPASLMTGCAAEAISTEITVDRTELDQAMWVSRQRVMESLAGLDPDLKPARKGSIARSLLEAWAGGRISARDTGFSLPERLRPRVAAAAAS